MCGKVNGSKECCEVCLGYRDKERLLGLDIIHTFLWRDMSRRGNTVKNQVEMTSESFYLRMMECSH